MKIENIILNAVSISKVSKVPVLFLSNPGYGKTTILQKYAKDNGYCLETIIGSRFAPEEISGFLVNKEGLDHLIHMNPEWFSRIWENENKGLPTLLFIDELSTCSEAVQGALLSLIFDRTIGNNKFLPEDCIIVSAANYANNVSSFMNILSPTLNRFAIINLNENYSPLDLVEEFLDESENTTTAKESEFNKMSKKTEDIFNNSYKEFWRNTFIKYSDTQSALGVLDITNQDIGGIYSGSEKFLYNFISGRSLSYLRRVIKAYIELGIDNIELFYKLIDGLVGSGTCSFVEKEQEDNYRKYIHSSMEKFIHIKKEEKIYMQILSKDISKDVSNFLMNVENLNTSADEDLRIAIEITNEICEQLSIEKVIANGKTNEGIAKFIADMEAAIEFQQFISKYPDNNNLAHKLSKTCFDLYGLYCDIIGIKPNFEATFGFNNKLFERVCFIKSMDAKNKPVITRGALRKKTGPSNQLIYKMDESESLLEAGLHSYYHLSDNFKVLVYDKGFKFIHIDNYCEKLKHIA